MAVNCLFCTTLGNRRQGRVEGEGGEEKFSERDKSTCPSTTCSALREAVLYQMGCFFYTWCKGGGAQWANMAILAV